MNFWTLFRPAFYIILGLGLVIFTLTSHVAPESKLKLLEGIPEKVEVTKSSRHNKVAFHLGDMRTDYADDDPNYSQVLESVSAKQPVKVWVEAEGYKDSYGRFYKMSVGDKPIVTYADTAESSKKSNTFSLWIGVALIFIGGFLIFKRMKG
jgi:hypothetical protein